MTSTAPTPAPMCGQVSFYTEVWRARNPSYDRMTIFDSGGPTEPHQFFWKNGIIIKVVTSDGTEYLFDDELDMEWLYFIEGDDGNVREPHLSFEDWIRLVKHPGMELDHLRPKDTIPETESQCPINAPMHMPVSGIDNIIDKGVGEVLAGRVEQVPRRPGETHGKEQDEEPPQAKRSCLGGPDSVRPGGSSSWAVLEGSPESPSPSSPSVFGDETPPSDASTCLSSDVIASTEIDFSD